MRGYLKNDTFFGLIALKSKILALNGWAADGVYRSADGGYNCWVSLCTKVKYCKHVQCTGLQVLGTQVYQPRTCSKRTCFYDQSVASSLWISEEVILYRPFKHPKNNKRLLPDLVAA